MAENGQTILSYPSIRFPVIGALVYLLGCTQPADILRLDPKAFSPDKEEVTLLFAGDASFARGIQDTISNHDDDIHFPLSRIAPTLQSADFSFVNLESVISDNTSFQADKTWVLHAPSEMVHAVQHAGIDLVSISNNHALDLGPVGFLDTNNHLVQAEVYATGLEHTEGAQEPVVLQIGPSVFAFLAYSAKQFGTKNDGFPRPHSFNLNAVIQDIEQAANVADHVIISLHQGHEYMMTPDPSHAANTRQLIDAGAEMVIAHHPHVPQQVEQYGDGLIAHSLGNFLFDMVTEYKKTRTRRGFMLAVTYKHGERVGVDLIPTNMDETFRPYIDETLDTDGWVMGTTVPRLSNRIQTATVRRGERSCKTWSIHPPTRPNQYMEWFRSRWLCPNDDTAPFLTVAQTGERSDSVFAQGLWAHPQPDEPLTLLFEGVLLGQTLRGFAGVPDHAHWLALQEATQLQPITMRVDAGPLQTELEFEVALGWQPIEIDTSSLAKTPVDITITLQGGTSYESGFVFDFWAE